MVVWACVCVEKVCVEKCGLWAKKWQKEKEEEEKAEDRSKKKEQKARRQRTHRCIIKRQSWRCRHQSEEQEWRELRPSLSL
jgi:hypothetical protein